MVYKQVRWFIGFVLILDGAVAMANSNQAEIHVYPSFGTAKRCVVRGRLLKKSRWIRQPKRSEGRFRIFMRGIRRFLTSDREIRHYPLRVRLRRQTRKVLTDEEGTFQATFHFSKKATSQPARAASSAVLRPTSWPTSRPLGRGVLRSHVQMLPAAGRAWQTLSASGLVVVPSSPRGVSVISDLDDTLIFTHVTKKSRMLYGVFFKNVHQIKLVPGGLAFLRALLRSPKGRGGGTLHYVTGSPVNLFRRIHLLFQLHGFPPGSLSMKKLGGKNKDSLRDQVGYKLSRIRPILKTYPKRRFVLVGDSGEKDADIYAQIRREFPAAIAWIYIHNVNNASPQDPRFNKMTLFTTYKDALKDAQQRGLIR